MKKPLKQLPTRVWRTYRGGKLLEEFLGYDNPVDSDYPEDWISSFLELFISLIYQRGRGER